MPALDTVADYLAHARTLLQDTSAALGYRYSDADLEANLNVALLEARRLRPDLFMWVNEVPTLTGADPVPIDQMYRSAIVYYIVGRTQLRDDESTTDQRAGGLLAKFTTQLLQLTA